MLWLRVWSKGMLQSCNKQCRRFVTWPITADCQNLETGCARLLVNNDGALPLCLLAVCKPDYRVHLILQAANFVSHHGHLLIYMQDARLAYEGSTVAVWKRSLEFQDAFGEQNAGEFLARFCLLCSQSSLRGKSRCLYISSQNSQKALSSHKISVCGAVFG